MLLLCACAAWEARGNLQRLEPAIHAALDEGVRHGTIPSARRQTII